MSISLFLLYLTFLLLHQIPSCSDGKTEFSKLYTLPFLINLYSLLMCIVSIAITVMFEQPTYSVNENAGPAQPVLVLSNPSSMTFNVTVNNTDGTATGE